MDTIKIVNGKIITPSGIKSNEILYLKNGIIDSVSSNNHHLPDAVVIDAGGNFISPGFIDIHLHGGGGHDFMDNDPEGFKK